MPQPALSPQEKRLASFCRLFAAVYAVSGLGFALFPGLTFHLVSGEPSTFGPEAAFWNALAVSMMAAIAAGCAVVAPYPRERRHALVPVIVAKITSSVLAAAHLGLHSRAVAAIIATDFPLFLLTLWIYRSSAPGVHSAAPTQTAPPAEPEAAKVQLGVTKPSA